MSCRILLADDHEVVRLGLKRLFLSQSEIVVCAEADNGLDTIRQVDNLNPDIVVLDLEMPRVNGVTATRTILRRNPRQKVLNLAVASSDAMIRTLIEAGIKGLVLKADPAVEVLNAVDEIRRGGTYFSASVQDRILRGFLHGQEPMSVRDGDDTLTLREELITELLVEGYVTKEIAGILHISPKTAETHRANLMRKLHVHNLAELTLYAASKRLINIPMFQSCRRLEEKWTDSNHASQMTATA